MQVSSSPQGGGGFRGFPGELGDFLVDGGISWWRLWGLVSRLAFLVCQNGFVDLGTSVAYRASFVFRFIFAGKSPKLGQQAFPLNH